MKKFIKYLFGDPSNIILLVALGLFLLLGIYFSIIDQNGFEDNQLWIYTVILVGIVLIIANIITYKDDKLDGID